MTKRMKKIVSLGSYVSGRRAAIPEYTEEILKRVQ
jgi:hypothetical protein